MVDVAVRPAITIVGVAEQRRGQHGVVKRSVEDGFGGFVVGFNGYAAERFFPSNGGGAARGVEIKTQGFAFQVGFGIFYTYG